MLTLNRNYSLQVESAYIITIQNHKISEDQAIACAESCDSVGQKHQTWWAFDGTSGAIQVPENLKSQNWLKWIKVVDHHLSVTEVACALSHISLWAHCIEVDQPIIVLEHDAIMVQAYQTHPYYNAIAYLGSLEQKKGTMPVTPIPPHGTLNPNYHMICRAHAYALDPAMANQLLSHVLRLGIHESLDVMIRPELFTIVQPGFYAYDNFQTTTIVNRKKDMSGKER